MKIGASLSPEKGYVEQVERLPDEFDLVEIYIGEQERSIDSIELERLEEVLEGKNLELVVHLPFRQPLATEVELLNDSVLEYLENLLSEITENLEVGKAVVHPGMRDKESNEELETLEKQVRRLKEIGENSSVEICFENVGHLDTPELFQLGEILEEKGASMCFDIGHAAMEKEEAEITEFLKKYSHLVSHLHVHDIRERGDSHLSIGDGWIDFGTFTDELNGFSGTAALEIFTDDPEHLQLSRKKFLKHL